MYAYLGTHKHTHIFLIRLVFICRLVVEIINGIHFGDCTITASESLISVRLFIFVRSETRSRSPSFSFVHSLHQKCKRTRRNVERVVEHAPYIHHQTTMDTKANRLFMYTFRPIYKQRSRSCVCVHFYHRFFTASRLIPVDQVSFHLTRLHACEYERARTPSHCYTAQNV